MSGKRAKAVRRAKTQEEQARRERGALWARRRRLAYWPAFFVVLAGLIAFFALRHNQMNSSANKASHGGGNYPYGIGTPGPGAKAPQVKLPATTGGSFDLAAYKGKAQVLLYFQEGLTCQPCWDQIAAIESDRAKFRTLGIGPIVSITTDSLNLIKQKANDEGLTIPVLADEGSVVSDRYDARTYSMTWMKPHRDGHTFILVGKDGRIRWRADYGGPPKYTMFLPVDALLQDLRRALAS